MNKMSMKMMSMDQMMIFRKVVAHKKMIWVSIKTNQKVILVKMTFLAINLNLFLSLDQKLLTKNWTRIIILCSHLDLVAACLSGIALAAVQLPICSNGSVVVKLQTKNLGIAHAFARIIFDYKRWWNQGKKNLKKNWILLMF